MERQKKERDRESSLVPGVLVRGVHVVMVRDLGPVRSDEFALYGLSVCTGEKMDGSLITVYAPLGVAMPKGGLFTVAEFRVPDDPEDFWTTLPGRWVILEKLP